MSKADPVGRRNMMLRAIPDVSTRRESSTSLSRSLLHFLVQTTGGSIGSRRGAFTPDLGAYTFTAPDGALASAGGAAACTGGGLAGVGGCGGPPSCPQAHEHANTKDNAINTERRTSPSPLTQNDFNSQSPTRGAERRSPARSLSGSRSGRSHHRDQLPCWSPGAAGCCRS